MMSDAQVRSKVAFFFNIYTVVIQNLLQVFKNEQSIVVFYNHLIIQQYENTLVLLICNMVPTGHHFIFPL